MSQESTPLTEGQYPTVTESNSFDIEVCSEINYSTTN
jgi:hypothetical protein